MAKRFIVLTTALLLIVSFGTGFAKGIDPTPKHKILKFGEHRLLYDPPASHLSGQFARSAVDTIWFGGTDLNGVAVRNPDGTALADAQKWDFEDGTLQGWNSVDQTVIGLWFRRRVSTDFSGDPVNVAAQNGTPLLWVGRHELEARVECWPGGQGYGNGWGMHAIKQYTYTGPGPVTLGFRYFVDSEQDFDFTYVYVRGGSQASPPLNTSLFPDANGFGYSGDWDPSANTNPGIGTPGAMVTTSLEVDVIYLPASGQNFTVDINFDSDPLFSDALDSFNDFLNSLYGPFGMDDFTVTQQTGAVTDNFNTGAPGWSFTVDPAIGTLLKVWPLADLDPIEDECVCPLSDPANTYVMIAAELDPLVNFPHPKKQREELRSPPAYVGADGLRSDRMVLWSAYNLLPFDTGVGYRVSMHYYPWTCDQTGLVGWTIEPAGPGGYNFFEEPDCSTYISNPSGDIPPSGVDSLKVIFEVLGDCDDFGTTACNGPEQSNQTPYFDDLVIGLAGLDVNAPILSIDLTYQDVFPGNTQPSTQTLLCTSTSEPHAYYDTNRADNGDVTNATMGDSVVVLTQGAAVHVFLNYRVYPGPCMNRTHPWYVNEYLAASAGDPGGWAEVEMDTVQVFPANIAQPGRYCSYVREGSPYFTPPEINPNPPNKYNPANKIIENGVLTPGTKIEYFFSSTFGNGPRAVFPDTSAAFYLEFEVLPGYIDVNASPSVQDIRTPCFLYVDAYNAGGQVPIEEWGLTPTLGTVNWNPAPFVPPAWAQSFYTASERWDRYDYLAAASNVPAPMARESRGDNGMSKYQSMVYRWMLYNTGTFAQEGLRDGDARLLQNWLINDDFGRNTFRKGLWLSGNGIAQILTQGGRPDNNFLASSFCKVSLPDPDPYRDLANGLAGDPSFCVKLDAANDRHFPASALSYASVRGSGCPTQLSFQIISPLGDAKGNLVYIDQDGTSNVEEFASVSNNQFSGGDGYGVLTDAFSVHYMRSTPDNFTGDGTDACTDSSAITNRFNDVFNWMQVTAAIICDPNPLFIDVDEPSVGPAIARTMLFQNAPNPFNPTTTVRYQLAEKASVSLQIFDVSGKLVRTLVDGVQEPEQYSVTWDGTTDTGKLVSSGVYWARMSTSRGFSASTKMVVLK